MSKLIGHEKQQSFLKQILQSERIPHALLFVGPTGIGKFKTAKLFAKSLLCEKGVDLEPCGECKSCHNFEFNKNPDVINFAENSEGNISAGSTNEEHTIRWLVSKLQERSFSDKRIVLIKNLGRINTSGQNILLKTIEEPTSGTFLIMTAPSKSAVFTDYQIKIL
jgi:DNA polymerase-3 subunit delta'